MELGRAASDTIKFLDGQLQRTILLGMTAKQRSKPANGKNRLHGSFAERVLVTDNYGAPVILESSRKDFGDKNTFGKGTVQTILPIGRFASLLGSHSDEDGALKLTIQKFYRVAGGSTQLHGVASDVILPSLSDLPEFGEGALKNALPYDEVAKARYTKWSDSHSLFIDQLRRRSEERVKNDPDFHYVM